MSVIDTLSRMMIRSDGGDYSVPLCFVYPAMLHYKAVAKTPTEKLGDILLGIFGMAAMVYTTAQTIRVWLDCPFIMLNLVLMYFAADGRT